MQFKQYPSYKPSGVEWLGDVPEHWNLKRFGYLFDENKKKNIGLKETNVLSLSYGNIKEKNIDDNKGLLPESFETYQIIEPNNIVFRFTDLQNDKRSLRSAISKYHGIITSAYIAVKTKQNADFYNYLFRAYDLQKVFYSMGEGMRQSLKMDELNKMPVVLPNKDEQKRIVSFLDTETTRIDNLITKQEKLIELLEEQRKSIISHAVTKGLNPNAPMKDSGVEWLGEVPEHWEVVKSKRLFWCKGGFAFSSDDFFEEGNYPVIRISNIQDKSISTDKIVYVNSCTKKVFNQFSAYTGDLIFCMTGASLGKVGLLPKELSFALINQRVGRLDITSYAIKQFVFYLVSSHGFQTNIRMLGVGLTDNFPNISSDLIGVVDVVLPPLVEQQGIVNHLEIENAKIDTLIEKQNQLIDKFKEYRASIISHAVTGKIDVREFGA
ncbi:restriction endonuclease subunit S [Acinetobacter radioresistens]|uniref:restriction endonuclease subunit S n=1 Tax=Acinetobacter radioresistens TaxID=40216 RepID=UPI000D0BC6F2|nr:restriction endonuclease subunit S [Acinetobacter radioresistens]PSD34788.1 restriction endonuclease subunit S [Acinetobacter radioresistens]PSD36572.1 restriction endonuclease subunit S [Acinetobacter radioresistens]